MRVLINGLHAGMYSELQQPWLLAYSSPSFPSLRRKVTGQLSKLLDSEAPTATFEELCEALPVRLQMATGSGEEHMSVQAAIKRLLDALVCNACLPVCL